MTASRFDVRRTDTGDRLYVIDTTDNAAITFTHGERMQLVDSSFTNEIVAMTHRVTLAHALFGRMGDSCVLVVEQWRCAGEHPLFRVCVHRCLNHLQPHKIHQITRVRAVTVDGHAINGMDAAPPVGIDATIDGVVTLINELGGFYVCDGVDLTQTLQRSQRCSAPSATTVDNQFIWNEHLWASESDAVRSRFFQRMIRGYCKQQMIHIDADTDVELTLIARRSRHNAGMRYSPRNSLQNPLADT